MSIWWHSQSETSGDERGFQHIAHERPCDLVNSVRELAPPPAGHLEYCCGRSSPWVTCRTPAKPTKRSWSLSPAEAGWILLRTVRALCEYRQEVQCRQDSGSTGPRLFRQLFHHSPLQHFLLSAFFFFYSSLASFLCSLASFCNTGFT